MKMVKVATLRGIQVKGRHVSPNEIIELTEKEAGLIVGSNAGVYVGDEKKAEAEMKKRRAAVSKAKGGKSAGKTDDKPAADGDTPGK